MEDKRVTVFSTKATTALLRVVRDKRTAQRAYVEAADRLCHLLAEEALASIAPVTAETIETPCGPFEATLKFSDPSKLCLVDIMRSGAILKESVRRLAPEAKTAKILIQRDEETALPVLMYSKLPPEIHTYDVILCDPMCATGGSAVAAIEVLKKAGVDEKRVLFANIVSCPEGLRRVLAAAPDINILTTAIDAGLNDRKFIVPGLGDFGDRYYGTSGYLEGLWGA